MKLQDRRKQRGISRFWKSFSYSWDGFKYAYMNEQSILIHLIAVIIVVVLGIWLSISAIEWLLCVCMFGFVLGAELLNTSIEATVDMAMPDIHPLAKIAKDTASAAVAVLAVMSAIVGLVIFVPKILEMLGIM